MEKKEEHSTEHQPSRRDFLKKLGIAAGAVAVTGGGLGLASSLSAKAKSGEKVQVMTTDGKVAMVDKDDVAEREPEEIAAEGREGIPGRKFVMVIDLSKCKNARKCMEACQGAHELRPEQHHINVLSMQDTPHTAPYHMPKPCFHCDNPPCVKVCPVDATFKRQDGIVLIDNERCIGCRFCIAGCPYSARVFHWHEPLKSAPEDTERIYDVELNVPQRKGTISKCLFSADKLRVGELPYCVKACPNGVYYFGDKNEDAVTNGTTGETVRFSELISDNHGYTYFEDLGTKPQVYYLPPKNRRFPCEPHTPYTGNTEA
jgi:Fe-S-cluster-containing dehydrogenase component